MKVLVIAAHPDDEVLGCGGTIARLAGEGHEVGIAILGEGLTARYENREQADRVLLDQLRARSRQAADVLKAKQIVTHDFPDQRLDTVALLEVIKIVEGAVAKFIPEVIYTHHAGDLNVDHQIVHRAVLTATRPTNDQPVKELYAFEVPSATEWAFQQIEPAFQPNVFVNISDTLELKIRAMSCYETEARAFPHPRSPQALEANARRWGSVAGCPAAEAFQLIRAVR